MLAEPSHGCLGFKGLQICHSLLFCLLRQVTKYQLDQTKEIEAKLKEEEVKEKMMALRREVGGGRWGLGSLGVVDSYTHGLMVALMWEVGQGRPDASCRPQIQEADVLGLVV